MTMTFYFLSFCSSTSKYRQICQRFIAAAPNLTCWKEGKTSPCSFDFRLSGIFLEELSKIPGRLENIEEVSSHPEIFMDFNNDGNRMGRMMLKLQNQLLGHNLRRIDLIISNWDQSGLYDIEKIFKTFSSQLTHVTLTLVTNIRRGAQVPSVRIPEMENLKYLGM